MARAPYATVKQGDYFYCVDTRNGTKVSYPESTRWNADQNTATLNNAYREALIETAKGN